MEAEQLQAGRAQVARGLLELLRPKVDPVAAEVEAPPHVRLGEPAAARRAYVDCVRLEDLLIPGEDLLGRRLLELGDEPQQIERDRRALAQQQVDLAQRALAVLLARHAVEQLALRATQAARLPRLGRVFGRGLALALARRRRLVAGAHAAHQLGPERALAQVEGQGRCGREEEGLHPHVRLLQVAASREGALTAAGGALARVGVVGHQVHALAAVLRARVGVEDHRDHPEHVLERERVVSVHVAARVLAVGRLQPLQLPHRAPGRLLKPLLHVRERELQLPLRCLLLLRAKQEQPDQVGVSRLNSPLHAGLHAAKRLRERRGRPVGTGLAHLLPRVDNEQNRVLLAVLGLLLVLGHLGVLVLLVIVVAVQRVVHGPELTTLRTSGGRGILSPA
eukprot:scaffold37481_cov75-Phaeocystis_antarctica.AAC.2